MTLVAVEEEDVETLIQILDDRILDALDGEPYRRMSKELAESTKPDRALRARLHVALDKARSG